MPASTLAHHLRFLTSAGLVDQNKVGRSVLNRAVFDRLDMLAGYILKQVRGNELVEGVRRVAAGQSLLDPAMTGRVLERLRDEQREDERLATLTDQERRILELLAEGLTNRQIGERMYLAEKTVKNYVSNVLMKLGMERRTEAAVYAARQADRRKRHMGIGG